MKIISLKKRKDFVDITQNGTKAVAKGLLLQVRPAPEGLAGCLTVGYTASSRLGNAVVRNRIKRKLRAAVAEVMPRHASDGWQYVLVGRHSAFERSVQDLVKDLKYTMHTTGTYNL